MRSIQRRARRPGLRCILALLVASALAVAACGSDDSSDDVATPDTADTAAPTSETTVDDESSGATGGAPDNDGDGLPSVIATIGDDVYRFTGDRCFITEDGGSDGGISVSDFVADDATESGAVSEIAADWSGDSPATSIIRLALTDGSLLEADAGTGDEFDVSISGSTATISSTFIDVYNTGEGEKPGTLEIFC